MGNGWKRISGWARGPSAYPLPIRLRLATICFKEWMKSCTSSLTNIFCGVRILRCEGRASEDALPLIRQINFVKLLVNSSNHNLGNRICPTMDARDEVFPALNARMVPDNVCFSQSRIGHACAGIIRHDTD